MPFILFILEVAVCVVCAVCAAITLLSTLLPTYYSPITHPSPYHPPITHACMPLLGCRRRYVFVPAAARRYLLLLSEAAKMFCDSPKLGNAARRVLAWIDAGCLLEKFFFWGVSRGCKRLCGDINYSAVAGDFEAQTGISPDNYSLVTTVNPYEDRYNIVFFAYV